MDDEKTQEALRAAFRTEQSNAMIISLQQLRAAAMKLRNSIVEELDEIVNLINLAEPVIKPSRSTSLIDHTQILKLGHLELDYLHYRIKWKGKEVTLTKTEFLMVEFLIATPDVYRSREQLMANCFPQQGMDLSDRTVDSHIKRIRIKFRKADKRFGQIITNYGIGYKWSVE